MANLITLILPLVVTFAVATWGPLSIRPEAQSAKENLHNNTRRPSPCED